MLLYLVTDSELMKGKDFYHCVEQAVKGGVTMVQLREKSCCTDEFLEKAKKLKGILSKYNVPLIINDRVDIAIASNADGVHIGQSDTSYQEVRNEIGKGKIIGLSVESKEQVYEANLLDVDYIAASPVFDTETKKNTITTWGYEGISWIKSISKHPVVAIGGMNTETISETIKAGADGVAVISAIVSSDNPLIASEKLIEIICASKL